MDRFANALIDALGGTTEVARKTYAGVSTVHNWRKSGLSQSRLDHLRRVAQDEVPSVDVAALAEQHGVELPCTGAADEPSSGTAEEVSQQVAA